jgi:hypothetical protein
MDEQRVEVAALAPLPVPRIRETIPVARLGDATAYPVRRLIPSTWRVHFVQPIN